MFDHWHHPFVGYSGEHIRPVIENLCLAHKCGGVLNVWVQSLSINLSFFYEREVIYSSCDFVFGPLTYVKWLSSTSLHKVSFNVGEFNTREQE